MTLLQLDKVPVAPAAPTDTVAGVPASAVARPRSADEVSAVLAAAAERGLTVIPRGAGTTLDWGAPPEKADLVLDTTALEGIVEHAAGDLVVVVRAGTRLADLQAALAGSGQRLALDGEHGPATLGGLVAAGLSGPSRLAFGTLRDLLIGATFVRADGVVAHTGGKVVKNVAGYDLGKLLHGSAGTLAVLTELTFRLHPLPEARRWVTVELAPDATGAAGALVGAVLHSQLVPAAIELNAPAGGPMAVSVLLEGRAAGLDARVPALVELVRDAASPEVTATAQVTGTPQVTDTAPPWWGHRPAGEPGSDAVLLRLTTEVAALPHLLTALDEAAATGALAVELRGSAGVGSLLAAVRPTTNAPPATAPATPTTPTRPQPTPLFSPPTSDATAQIPGTGGGLGRTPPTEGRRVGPPGRQDPSRASHPATSPPAPAAIAELVGRLRRNAGRWGGTVVVLDGPAASLAGVDRWGPVAGLGLMRNIKERFDPNRTLSPGRFVGGI